MNFTDIQLRDRPVAVWRWNGFAFTDISGSGMSTSGTVLASGTPITHGGSRSQIVASTNLLTLSTPNYFWRVGYERRSFSIEIVAGQLILNGSNQLVLGHSSAGGPNYDGIVMTAGGQTIQFSVKFASGLVTCSYNPLGYPKAHHIVAVYTPTKIMLYVDGLRVATTEIPTGWMESGFSHGADTSLTCGQSANGTAQTELDGVAYYNYALSDQEIADHANYVTNVSDANQIVSAYSGTMYPGTERNIMFSKTWDGVDDWQTGTPTNVSWNDSGLYAMESQETATLGQTLAGTWVGIFEVGSYETAIDSMQVYWDAQGTPTVAVSFDEGSNWTTVNNGDVVPTSVGWNPNGKNVLIRVSFTAGVVSDTRVMQSLTLRVFGDNFVSGYGTRRSLFVIGNKLVSSAPAYTKPIEHNSNGNLRFSGAGSSLRLSGDPDGNTIRGFEFWIRSRGAFSGAQAFILTNVPDGGTTQVYTVEPTGNLTFANATVYVNGAAVTSGTTSIRNRYVHLYIELPSANNIAVTIGSGEFQGEILHFATYANSMTAGQVGALYNLYTDNVTLAQTNSPNQTIAEPVGPYVMTVTDWAVQPQQ